MSNLRSKLGGREASGARELLAALRERPDVTHEVATTIDSLLAGHADDIATTHHPGDDAAATRAGEATSPEPVTLLTPATEEEDRGSDIGSAAAAAPAAVAQDLPDVEEKPPPAAATATRSDSPPPPREADAASPPLSQVRQGSRRARVLVVLGGGLVFLSVSVVPWMAAPTDERPRDWWDLTFLLTHDFTNGSQFGLRNWFGVALGCVLVAAVIAVAAMTQVRPVRPLVRVIACIINGLAVVLGFRHRPDRGR